MTVKELIAKLESMDENLQVTICDIEVEITKHDSTIENYQVVVMKDYDNSQEVIDSYEQQLKEERNKAIVEYRDRVVAELDKVQGSWSHIQVKLLLEALKK
jgi:2-oxoglutarate dehydrogenase complex dehydrogenase (E1) component-like enzyme